jgi:hypothetical protein
MIFLAIFKGLRLGLVRVPGLVRDPGLDLIDPGLSEFEKLLNRPLATFFVRLRSMRSSMSSFFDLFVVFDELFSLRIIFLSSFTLKEFIDLDRVFLCILRSFTSI